MLNIQELKPFDYFFIIFSLYHNNILKFELKDSEIHLIGIFLKESASPISIKTTPVKEEPVPTGGYIIKSVVNYQLMSLKRKNNRVILGQMLSAPMEQNPKRFFKF